MMVQRRAFPRTPFERHGQVNYRPEQQTRQFPNNDINDGLPNCHVVVTQRKGWGTTGPHESAPMGARSVNLLLKSLSVEKHYRYKVNIYLKKDGNSQVRRDTRGW